MATKYGILVAFVALAILSRSSTTLASSFTGSYVGAFDVTNNAGGDIVVQCVGVADQGNTSALGTVTLETGSKWGLGVQNSATKAINCSFSFAGFLDENLAMWEKNNTPHDAPFNCIDCHWIVDQQGFCIMNPENGQYIAVANWTPPGL